MAERYEETVDRSLRPRERDLVLAPGEFMFIQDTTKGRVDVYCGPHKHSLSNTDVPVVFDRKTKRFLPREVAEAKQTSVIAPENWYVILLNPEHDGKHPKDGGSTSIPDGALEVGRKVVIPGPCNFALWPGQMAEVVRGHELRTDEFLVVRVYDGEAATRNRQEVRVEKRADALAEGAEPEKDKDSKKEKKSSDRKSDQSLADTYVTGQLIVIPGTEAKFFMPSTGLQVVPENEDEVRDSGARPRFVRKAVSLEQLEYCVLLDENGEKTFRRGPDVVFPEPTQSFVTDPQSGSPKYRALELSEQAGVHIKVIEEYEEDGDVHSVGQELFITGKEQPVLFPRKEWSIVTYGANGEQVHFGVSVPPGEGRYVLHRTTGNIRIERGPVNVLLDPRVEVFCQRVLPLSVANLIFENDPEAQEHFRRLAELAKARGVESGFIESEAVLTANMAAGAPAGALRKAGASRGQTPRETFAGDAMERRTEFTQPRTVTLNTRLDGAVVMEIPTGYAAKLVRKSGASRVEVGPKAVVLEFDELPEVIRFSTGTPKRTDNRKKSVCLRVQHNRVSDVIAADTSDMVLVKLHLAYRVNFVGEEKKWFSVDDYVGFLTDHARSRLANCIKRHTIAELTQRWADIVRDEVLGEHSEEGRGGLRIDENGMLVYEVECLKFENLDSDIANRLFADKRDALTGQLRVGALERAVDLARREQSLEQDRLRVEEETAKLKFEVEKQRAERDLALKLKRQENETALSKQKLDASVSEQEQHDAIHQRELARGRAGAEMRLALSQSELEQEIKRLRAEVEADEARAKAVGPDVVAALQQFSDRHLAAAAAKAMAPMALLGGKEDEGVADVLARLLGNTVLGNVFKNGHDTTASALEQPNV